MLLEAPRILASLPADLTARRLEGGLDNHHTQSHGARRRSRIQGQLQSGRSGPVTAHQLKDPLHR